MVALAPYIGLIVMLPVVVLAHRSYAVTPNSSTRVL